MFDKIIDTVYYVASTILIIISMYFYSDSNLSKLLLCFIIVYMTVIEILKNKGKKHITHLKRGIRAVCVTAFTISLSIVAIGNDDNNKINSIAIKMSGCEIKNNISNGYIEIQNNDNENPVVVQVLKDNKSILYNCYIEKDNLNHKVLMTQGKGQYQVVINIKDIKDDTYKKVAVYEDMYDNEEDIYKYDSYNVEYNKYKDSILKLIEREGWDNSYKSSKDIFEYFREFEYDKVLEDKVNNSELGFYNTNVKDTIENRKGICIDFASAIACVERTLGNKARVCVGTTQSGTWHSWCEVYMNNDWIPMDTLRQTTFGEDMTDGINVKQYY